MKRPLSSPSPLVPVNTLLLVAFTLEIRMRLLRDISLISEHVLTPLRCEYEREFELTAAVLRPPVEPTGGEYRMFTVAENTTKQ